MFEYNIYESKNVGFLSHSPQSTYLYALHVNRAYIHMQQYLLQTK